jgi:diacylglycerol kinase (ATP)
MRICVIFNPTARGNQARRFRARLDRLTGACAFKPTTGPGAATFLAAEAVGEGFDTVVAAGGDGTVSEVVTGLAQAAEGLARCRLGLLPLGTINVFARELGVPLDLEGAWATVLQGRETRVDLPFAEFRDATGERRRCFTQLAGAGLDSRAIAGVEWEWKKRLGWLAYVLAGLRALRERPSQVRVSGGGYSVVGELVLIGNGRFYGGEIPMFPQASLQDGQLDVRVFPRADWGTLLRFGWNWLWRRFPVPADQTCFRARQVELISETALPFELDGDNVGLLPVRLGVLPLGLRVLQPMD